MFDWLTHAVTGSPLTYLIVALAAGGDVLLPLIPSETIVITAGVLAAQGRLSIWLVVLPVAVGAFIGDNVVYWLGRGVGDPIARRLFKGEKARRRLEWAEKAIRSHGPLLVVVGRFIPGGRSAGTFAAGTLCLGYRRFLLADAVAAGAWALYASLLGYLGGSAFRDNTWEPLLLSLGVAAAITLAIEAWRRHRRRQGKDLLGDDLRGGRARRAAHP
jgi:membrane protein DedA with SNARE-associated domain